MRRLSGLGIALSIALLSSCTQDTLEIIKVSDRQTMPLPPKMQQKLIKLGLSNSSPIMMRIFKEEEILEVWKANSQNRYQLVATFPICAWSGQLGPKKKEGDRQAPEGFYNISPGQMNPNSDYYLSFNIGYPNKFDRAHGRTGSNLMVHGACSSAGCYSMSDAAVLQIYAFARDAFKGGQKSFQVQAYPFRMTAENMAKHRFSPHYAFWQNIKTGYDYFELTHRPPEVEVCNRQYVFNQVADANTRFNATGSCPSTTTPPALASAYASYSKTYEAAFSTAAAKYAEGSWTDTPEFERKAAERRERRTRRVARASEKVPNDAAYVVVDPKAKLTPTSDTVTSYAEAYERIEARRNGTEKQVEYISVAEIEARKKAEAEKRKAEEKLAKQMARTKVPVPEANPIKPAEPAVAESKTALDAVPFWKRWTQKPAEPQNTVAVATPPAAAAPAASESKPKDQAKAKIAPKPGAKTETVAVPTPETAPAPVAEKAEKPFWKLW
jgi:murein L,D-transpeptidase YafK